MRFVLTLSLVVLLLSYRMMYHVICHVTERQTGATELGVSTQLIRDLLRLVIVCFACIPRYLRTVSNVRATFFSERVINVWNFLPKEVDFASLPRFICTVQCADFSGFYQRVSIASYANRWYSQRRNVRPSVRLSVRHTPVLYQNEES